MYQKEFIGKGSISRLVDILDNHNPITIFLVTDKNSYEKCGAKSILDTILQNYKVAHFNDFQSIPKVEDIKRGLDIFKENDCDFVLAVGGGSVIDVAKSINIINANLGDPVDFIQKKREIKNKGKIIVTIPTTAGSGSQATHFAVVYLGKTKYSFGHKEFILPDYAIVDPVLTESLPPYITACTGMDVLGQGVESYWCINSTGESKKYAKDAIKLTIKYLPEAVNNPSMKSREAMARAAHLAGKAINITKTTASHSISYPMTSYFNVPHGHAVALTLAQMLVYNSQVTKKDVLDKRGVEYVENTIKKIVNLTEVESVEDARKKITTLMNEINLSTKLSELGIKTDEDIELLIKNGFNPERVKNNPRKLTEDVLRKILIEIR